MKKEFLYGLGFVFIACFSLDGCSMEKFQVKGKAESGSSIFFWGANGSEKFCDSMKKNLAETMQTGKEERFIVPSPEDQKNPVIQIYQDGRLLVNRTEKLKHFVIRDPHGKTIMNTNQKQKQLDSGSLDEEDIKRKVEKLQVGESITAVFFDDSKLCVTFDQIITLVSTDGSEHPARWSQVRDSWLISGAMGQNWKEKSEKIIELGGLTGKEIEMFLKVAALGKEERKKLLAGLSIFDHIVSVANIHMHYFSKKFFSVCWDNLIKRVCDLLKKGDVSWFEKVLSLENDREKNIQLFTESLLKRIIRPVPKVLFEKEGVKGAEFTLDGTRVIVVYHGNRAEIIDMESGEAIFTRNNVESIGVTEDGTRVLVRYRDKKAEVIGIESGETILKRDNVSDMRFTTDGTRVIVGYVGSDNRAEIIDTESGETIFTRNNFMSIGLTEDGTKALVGYLNNRAEIIEIKSGETIFTRNNVSSIGLTEDGTKVLVRYQDNRIEIIKIESGEIILKRDNARITRLTEDGTRVIVFDIGGEVEIIKIESGETILKRDNAGSMGVTADGTRTLVRYQDNRAEIIDVESGETILKRDNASSIDITKDESKVIVCCVGSDCRAEIIDIESGETILKRDNVCIIAVTEDASKVIVLGRDNKLKILDLEDYDRGIDFVKFNPEQLLFVFNLSRDPDCLIQDKNNARVIWQSFDPEVQKKLKESYFPAIDFQ